MVQWGRLEINSLFLSRTHDRIAFHSIPFHSIPILSIPFHSNPFHSIPFHVLPNAIILLGCRVAAPIIILAVFDEL